MTLPNTPTLDRSQITQFLKTVRNIERLLVLTEAYNFNSKGYRELVEAAGDESIFLFKTIGIYGSRSDARDALIAEHRAISAADPVASRIAEEA